MDVCNLLNLKENYIDTAEDLCEENSIHQDAPSYVAQYDYENDYNNSPLVYSFFPLVPGFANKETGKSEDNIRVSCNNLDVSLSSITSIESFVISNQDNIFKEYFEFKELNKIQPNYETKNIHNLDSSSFYHLDNSCNAVDIIISRKESENAVTQLSFDGKIKNLANSSPNFIIKEEKTEEERLLNESFEILRKEDSSKMLFLNEKSPDLFEKNVSNIKCNNAAEKSDKSSLQFSHISDNKADACELYILNKLNSSMNGICPPPSITRFQMSLHDMLASFKKNTIETFINHEETQTSSFFKPSNTMNEVLKMEWPEVIRTKFHDIAYNKSTISEEIEVTCLRYCERFIGSETSSSFNNEVSSAKKRNDRLKLLARSPGKRLSHLAKRRSIFSSANLKSNCQPTSVTSRHILIDKTKRLFHQKSNMTNSQQKKSQQQMSKKKTPKSKEHPGEIIEKLTITRETSKRALFKSPSEKLSLSNNRKRIRSETVENLNFENKIRRLDISTEMQSIPSDVHFMSSSRNDDHVKKRLFSGVQSDVIPLGIKQPMTTDIKRKLLWATSQSLASKQISKDHHKFKEYATLLVKLTKRLFTEFFCPSKSVSGQMLKYSNNMVFFVIQGRNFEDIYSMTKARLEKSICHKEFNNKEHTTQKDLRQNEFLQTNAMLSSSTLSRTEELKTSSFPTSTKKNKTLSSEKCLTSSTSKNNESFALRENFIRCNQRNSTAKTTVQNEKIISNHGNTTNLQKAKRQISF
ncbi:unnamed protein product [Diamesa tonsa]